MKKIPSVRANNERKERVVSELKALVYQLEKGKFHVDLDRESVLAIAAALKEEALELERTVGTGEEQIAMAAERALGQIKELRKSADQSYLNRFEGRADDLMYTLGCWRSALNGEAGCEESEEEFQRDKITWTRRKLNARLEEVRSIKNVFSGHEIRLESEIKQLEKDLAELDELMLGEENERRINDLYRKISTMKSKIDMLEVRKNNYSACYNLLDMIDANASEIVEASDVAGEEIGKAKALLNINKLRSVLSEPDKALSILKCMQEDVNAVAEHTRLMDKKVFSLSASRTLVSSDALKYKEELMRRRSETELARTDEAALERAQLAGEGEGEKNGIL